ncbi:MAG: hypothetical protein ACFCU3_09800 [Verrucomicrobiales bacterium]
MRTNSTLSLLLLAVLATGFLGLTESLHSQSAQRTVVGVLKTYRGAYVIEIQGGKLAMESAAGWLESSRIQIVGHTLKMPPIMKHYVGKTIAVAGSLSPRYMEDQVTQLVLTTNDYTLAKAFAGL